jgi:propionyl-CoA carboxylase beta chain
VGIIANNPAEPGSPIENDACDKQYRFIRVLDAYNIPLVTLIDTPPFVPGDEWERQGLIRHVGKLIYSYSIATVPKISLIMRRAYADAGSIAMGGSKSFGVDFCFAWPMAQLAVEASKLDMSGKLGVDPDAYTGYLGKAREKASVFEVAKRFTTAVIDEIIDPADTRKRIIEALQMMEHKQETLPPRAKKHGTPPT